MGFLDVVKEREPRLYWKAVDDLGNGKSIETVKGELAWAIEYANERRASRGLRTIPTPNTKENSSD